MSTGKHPARGDFAHQPSLALADAVLAILDRVELLASTLAMWEVERGRPQGAQS